MNIKNLVSALIIALLVSACSDSSTPSNADIDLELNDQVAQYTCPMHPHYISTDPDGSCPICGMDLVPVKSNANADTGIKTNSGITVSSPMLQTMGVRISKAEVIEFGRTLRAFGTVEADERLENVSVSRLEGWIEDLNVRAEGDTVVDGDLLYRIYSPDLIAAQRDYVGALGSGNATRTKSVKQRLLSTGMQEQAIQQLTQRKTVIDKVPVYAETNGVVSELNVRDGDYIKPGTAILRLQSYSKVWVIASIPETDLSLIDLGITAKLRFPSAPEATLNAKVDYIYPTVDPKTRTGRVRIEVNNDSGDLLPGAYADITLGFSKQKRLSIVSEAILRDSRGDHVILALGDGRFDTRIVTSGISAEGRTEILAGLQEGDLVVSSGQFMLDSEVNLREGLSKLSSASPKPVHAPSAVMDMTASASKTLLSEINPDANSLAQINHLVDMALYFHASLIGNKAIDPKQVDPAIKAADVLAERYAGTELVPILRDSKTALIAAQSNPNNETLENHLNNLVTALKPWLLNGAPQHYSGAGLLFFRELNTGRLWLQIKAPVKNPYGNDESEILAWPAPITGSNAEKPHMHSTVPNESGELEPDSHAAHR